ncbi:MAG: lysophospholipid acyltransferase family protein [Chloroflexi bacterium]|nr:lysophospholipid acyltransferase family protein [Chloroflexota bacterium]
MTLFVLWRLLGPVSRRLPTKASYSIGRWLGWVAFWISPRIRRNALLNATYLVGSPREPEHIQRLALRMVQSYAYYLADFLRLPSLRRNGWEKQVVFQGQPELDAAVQEGKGVILVGLHLGSWDLGGAALAWSHYPVNAIVEEQASPRLCSLARKLREGTGVKVISRRDVRQMMAALRRGEVLCLLIDRPSNGGGAQIEFMGHPARVPSGAAVLALRTGARVLPGAVVHLPNGQFLVRLGPSIPYHVNGRGPQQEQQLTQSIMAHLETVVSQHREQWCIYHPFWLNGEPSPKV